MRVKTTDSREIKACGHPRRQCNELRLYVVVVDIRQRLSNLYLTSPDCFYFYVSFNI